jgi:hypothetical protein
MATRDPYGALGREDDSEVALAAIRAVREVADFCEYHPVSRMRQAGHTSSERSPAGLVLAPRRYTRSRLKCCEILRGRQSSS